MKNPSNPLIFIIDKSSAYRNIIKDCLEALNYYNICTFSSSEECIKMRPLPDVIILDQELGRDNQSGLDFLYKYKHRYSNTFFLFLSSNTNIDIAVDSIKWGAYDYIIKSKLGLEHLVMRLDKLVESQKKYKRSNLLFKAALISMGVFSLIILIAVILYK